MKTASHALPNQPLMPTMRISRHFQTSIVLTSIGVSLVGAAGRIPEAIKRPPNVLMIAVDDFNDWTTVLAGHPQVKTPHIDRLAASGTTFTNAHCQAPLCGPSRASLFTGLNPSTTGIYLHINDDNIKRASEAAWFAPADLLERARILAPRIQETRQPE